LAISPPDELTKINRWIQTYRVTMKRRTRAAEVDRLNECVSARMKKSNRESAEVFKAASDSSWVLQILVAQNATAGREKGCARDDSAFDSPIRLFSARLRAKFLAALSPFHTLRASWILGRTYPRISS
jgi:hypothetical protein